MLLSRMRTVAILAAAAALLIPTRSEVGAQTVFGVLRGRVVDEQQQPIAGATVELSREGQGVFRRATTNMSGAFQFPALPTGTYGVRAQQIGYMPGREQRVGITGGETELIELALALAPVELEGVEVTTSSIEIERENVEFSTAIQERQIELLPSSYDASDLVALTPGARAGHVWGGATMQANNYQLDGLAANHPGVGGDLVQPSVNWIERIEVKGLGAGAEYGNFQGGLINVITKSGTNEFEGAFRTSLENQALNSTNLVPTEVGSETAARYDFEGEVRGPLIRDHLFYYLAGQWTENERQVLDHLPYEDRTYSDALEDRSERKLFSKLTWAPAQGHEIEGSFGFFDTRVEHYGNTGYETPEATLRLEAPTSVYNLAWRGMWSDWLTSDVRVAHISLDETRDPYNGPDNPGMQFYGFSSRLYPPEPSFNNAPIYYRHAPASLTGSANLTMRFRTGSWEHMVTAGAEHSIGTFTDQRIRSGDMTWRPTRRASLDTSDPSTWPYPASDFVPITTGGEVDLHAEVENSAAYVQGSFAIGRHVAISPGVRFGRWEGRLLPGGDESRRFTALQDQAWEPRIGAMVDFTGNNSFVGKAHWGRYHQSMIAQFFDRVEGGEVFTNEELWYYDGPMPADRFDAFSAEERQALIDAGQLTFQNHVVLNETGPVVDYDQPYVDQWVMGLEKTVGNSVRLEAVYVNRRNRNMVALVDRNRATNYTVYEYVRVMDASGTAIGFEGGSVQLLELWVPNNMLADHLRCFARRECGSNPAGPIISPPPGLTYADTLNLTWDPDYVLTNAPGAQRKFDQFQFSAEVVRPTWGSSLSWVFTNLEGNLDNVTGYDDPTGYGAGPYVRVNEGVNSYGKLPNFSDQEMKASVWGNLLWGLRGGLFWTKSSGDHYSPQYTISGTGQYTFAVRQATGLPRYAPQFRIEPLHYGYMQDMEGHQVFIGPRGAMQHRTRVRFDVHLEREFNVGPAGWTLSLDVFNVLNYGTVTEVNPSVNHGRNYYHFLPGGGDSLFRTLDANQYFKAVLDRVPPRTVRIGTVVRF